MTYNSYKQHLYLNIIINHHCKIILTPSWLIVHEQKNRMWLENKINLIPTLTRNLYLTCVYAPYIKFTASLFILFIFSIMICISICQLQFIRINYSILYHFTTFLCKTKTLNCHLIILNFLSFGCFLSLYARFFIKFLIKENLIGITDNT